MLTKAYLNILKMEDIIFFILCFLSTINMSFKCLNCFFTDYMDLNNTSSIKGIFVWIIVLQHYRGYYRRDPNYIYHKILNCTRQKMVSIFLFYSGYGIYESIKKNGFNYVMKLPKKGIILLIKFEIILCFYLLINLILRIKISFNRYLLAIIFKVGIGNSYWFSFTIISFYLYSYLSFRFIKKTKFIFAGIFFINVISLLHIILIYNFYHQNSLPSVDNILCFNIGLYYSLIRKDLDKIIMKNDFTYFGFLSLILIIYTYFYNYKKQGVLIASIINSFFSLIIILISMKIQFNNDFLLLLNSHSYSIYLLQRLIIKYIKYKNFFRSNNFIRFFITFFIILFASSIFDKKTEFLNKLTIIKKTNKKKILYILNDEAIKININ